MALQHNSHALLSHSRSNTFQTLCFQFASNSVPSIPGGPLKQKNHSAVTSKNFFNSCKRSHSDEMPLSGSTVSIVPKQLSRVSPSILVHFKFLTTKAHLRSSPTPRSPKEIFFYFFFFLPHQFRRKRIHLFFFFHQRLSSPCRQLTRLKRSQLVSPISF